MTLQKIFEVEDGLDQGEVWSLILWRFKGNHMAFMDGTSLIGKSKEDIKELHDTCKSFF